MMSEKTLFVVSDLAHGGLYEAVEAALQTASPDLGALPVLTNVALGDPYLAQQLIDLHTRWEIRPQPQRGLMARLRTRLAWWLLGSEIRQANAVHGTLVRLIDSLVVQL